MVNLYLTRHGETEENLKGVLQGQSNGTLSPLGLRQAEGLALRMESVPLEAIISSKLSRSVITAEAVAARHPNALFVETELLNEVDTGIYTGKPASLLDWHNLPDEGMESIEELYARAGRLLDWLRSKFDGKCLLAVGHGAYNRAIVAAINGTGARSMLEFPIMGNTEVMQFFI